MNRAEEQERRRHVWLETKNHYSQQPLKDSIRYDSFDAVAYADLPRPHTNTIVEFVQADCIEVALREAKPGIKPLLLNMASEFKPGGGVENGVHTQEEELFRRSNYHKFLHRRHYPTPPIHTSYSAGVEFYRGGAAVDYALYTVPQRLDCIAVAGLRKPLLTDDQRRIRQRTDIEILETKLRLLFYVAAKQGNDVLILSALGCGAFACPPVHVAMLFKKVVAENTGRFRKIIFAILGSNYEPFKAAYEKFVPPLKN